MENDRDRKRLLAPKYSGEKGEAFEKWAKGFLDAADGEGDEEGS